MLDATGTGAARRGFVHMRWETVCQRWLAPITMTVVSLAPWLSVITLGIEATEASKSAAMSVSLPALRWDVSSMDWRVAT